MLFAADVYRPYPVSLLSSLRSSLSYCPVLLPMSVLHTYLPDALLREPHNTTQTPLYCPLQPGFFLCFVSAFVSGLLRLFSTPSATINSLFCPTGALPPGPPTFPSHFPAASPDHRPSVGTALSIQPSFSPLFLFLSSHSYCTSLSLFIESPFFLFSACGQSHALFSY